MTKSGLIGNMIRNDMKEDLWGPLEADIGRASFTGQNPVEFKEAGLV